MGRLSDQDWDPTLYIIFLNILQPAKIPLNSSLAVNPTQNRALLPQIKERKLKFSTYIYKGLLQQKGISNIKLCRGLCSVHVAELSVSGIVLFQCNLFHFASVLLESLQYLNSKRDALQDSMGTYALSIELASYAVFLLA